MTRSSPDESGRGERAGDRLGRLVRAVSWTRPTSTDIAVVAKSALAAGLAWWIAAAVTEIEAPVLASLTALVALQVSARASLRTALERSAAVVVGVLLALAVGDALALNAVTVGLLVGVTLGVAELGFRLPRAAARQVPISGLLVLTAVATSPTRLGWERAVDTLIGAAVGVAVSLVLPASRLVDARQTLQQLADELGNLLDEMGAALQETWSTEQTEAWRTRARTVRVRLVDQAIDAVGNSRDVSRWNLRDRRHLDALTRYEEVLPRLQRTAIGVSVISRGLDDHARLGGGPHPSIAAMGDLLGSVAAAVRAVVAHVLGDADDDDVRDALEEVKVRRDRCLQGAERRARLALERADGPDASELSAEWLGYTALLVQVDRIRSDLGAPLPDR